MFATTFTDEFASNSKATIEFVISFVEHKISMASNSTEESFNTHVLFLRVF